MASEREKESLWKSYCATHQYVNDLLFKNKACLLFELAALEHVQELSVLQYAYVGELSHLRCPRIQDPVTSCTLS